MRYRSNTLKTLGLCLIAMFAFSIAAATAQASPDWVFNAETLEELGLESKTIEGSGGSLTLEAPESGITIKCTAQSVSGSVKKAGKGNATIKMTECTLTSSEKSCSVVEPISLKVSHALTEVEEVIYDVLTPESGEVFATVEFKGEKCALKATKLTGSTAASTGAEAKPLTLTLSKEAATKTKSQLLFGGKAATFTGTVKQQPAGGQPMGAVLLTTALCNSVESPCKPPKTFGANTTLEAQPEAMTEAELKLPGAPTTTISCKASTLTGETLAERAQPLGIKFTTFAFSMCSPAGCSVPASTVGANGALRFTIIGNGNLTIPTPMIETKCPGQKCKFEKPTLVMPFEGETPPIVKGSVLQLNLLTTVEGTCPTSLFWTVKYRLQGLGQMIVSR